MAEICAFLSIIFSVNYVHTKISGFHKIAQNTHDNDRVIEQIIG